MAAKKIVHIDDSALVRKTVKNALSSAFSESDFSQCESIADLKKLLDEKGRDISLIITDLHMPNYSGYNILEWLKSHPLYHHIPTIVLSAESSPEGQRQALKKGALFFLQKPYTADDLQKAVSIYSSNFDERLISEIDETFVNCAFEILHEVSSLLIEKENNYEPKILRKLHQMKGDALTGHWPILAYFIHDIEDIWSLCMKNKNTNSKQLHDITADAIIVMINMISDIKDKKPHRLPPAEFFKDVEHLKKSIEKGWTTPSHPDFEKLTSKIPNQVEQTSSIKKSSALDLLNNDSIRISRNKLDNVYGHIKKVAQVRSRLSVYTNQLKQEFSDEPFIIELNKMIQDLGAESNALTEFFLILRAKEIKSLLEYISKTVKECSDQLGKPSKVNIVADETLLVDSSVLQILESLFGHLIRNSIDHGLESEQDRIEKNKPKQGLIEIEFFLNSQKNEIDDQINIRFKDDGAGINLSNLRKKIISLGLLTEEKVNKLSEKNLTDFIFMDAVSTKEQSTIYSGRGVGLSLIKKNITDLGGTISVETSDSGTCFEVQVPRYFKV